MISRGPQMQKTIVYELNEVPLRLFNFYADTFKFSAFSKLRAHGLCYQTKSPDIGHLSPWITWPTMHRGVPNVTHKISDLGQTLTHINHEMPSVWEILAQAGIRVGVFGSLHSYPLPDELDNFDFYVPDTFAAGEECFPADLSTFQRFNLSMVKNSGRNVHSGVAIKDAKHFIKNSISLGIKPLTFSKILNQLCAERLNKSRVVRRRTSQAEISFDLFFKQLFQTQPDVSFFFTNHVASAMHRYWPTIFPDDYAENKFDSAWLNRWRGEIPHAVKVANYQLNRLIRYADTFDCKLIVATSMGQEAVENVQKVENQVLISDINQLMCYLGCESNEWSPRLAMAPQVVIRPHADSVYDAIKKLDDILINDTKITYHVTETRDIRFEIHLQNVKNLDIRHEAKTLDPKDTGLKIVSLQDAAGANAYHIPEGVLISYRKNFVGALETDPWQEVSTLDFTPSLLNSFAIPKRSYMLGRSDLFL